MTVTRIPVGGDRPHEIVVGTDTDAGQTPLPKLSRQLTRRGLGKRNLTPSQATEYSKRLEAIASKTGPMANLPKGPLPKGARMPKMPKQQR